MKILSVETSTRHWSLAVSDDEKVLRYRNYTTGPFLSSSIIRCIKNVLKVSGIPLEAIDGYAVSLGPGSFTGLRVGLATVKALAYAMDKPIVGVSALDIMAMNVKAPKARICCVGDAKKQLVSGCLYEKGEGHLKKRSDYWLCDIDTLLERIDGPVIFIGDGLPLYKNEILKSGKAVRLEDGKNYRPQAKNMPVLVMGRFFQKDYENIDQLVPLYLHPEDCQVKRKKQI